MQFLLIILKLNISGEIGRRSSTAFGFLMPCWYSYSYHDKRYIFGQGDMTCLRRSKRSLNPSKTKYHLGKHPNKLMPYKIIPRYGLRTISGTTPMAGKHFCDFSEMYYKMTTSLVGQSRPMKYKFCRDFVGTNAGYWR